MIQFEIDQRALGAADPVALHGAHFFRPALQPIESGEKLLGITGGAKEPLLQVALLDHRGFMPPATTGHDLLIGKHRLAFGTPIDSALFPIGQIALEELEEKPLIPLVVFR